MRLEDWRGSYSRVRERDSENLNKAESEGWGTEDGFEMLLGENREETSVVRKGERHQG